MPSTLLDFFKKLPAKKAEKTSPVAGDTPHRNKSNSPQEDAKEDNESVKSSSNRDTDSTTHVEEVEMKDSNDNIKRTRVVSVEEEDEDSDNDEVTGRKYNSKRPRRSATSKSLKPAKKKQKPLSLDSESEQESGDEYIQPAQISSDEECSSGVEEGSDEDMCEEEPENVDTKKRKRSSNSTKKTPKRRAPSTPCTPQQSSNQQARTPNSTPNFLSPSLTSKLANSVGKAMSTLSKFQASSPSNDNDNSDTNLFTHEQLDWLKDDKIRDKEGRKKDDPNYDPRTLHVSSSFLSSKAVTPGMRQWWKIKMDNFDTILFFKVGKFYELYHMDATVAVKELGLIYMKGKFAHAGFPEISYGRYSDMLIQKGYKVARVEQTETPQMMSVRTSGKGEKVVKRELCAITSKATKMFRFNEGDVTDDAASYLLAIKESSADESFGGKSSYGVCFIDTSIGKFHIGQFDDDRQCSRLRTLIANQVPAQILLERNSLSKKTQTIIQQEMISTIKEQLFPGTQFWDAEKTLKYLQESEYFNTGSLEWPAPLEEMTNGDAVGHEVAQDYTLAMSAFGACIWYLEKCLIVHELLSMKNFQLYKPLDEIAVHRKSVSFTEGRNHMMLDGVTLTNLDVVPNGVDIPLEGTLLEQVDNCSTSFGKRLFKQWLCSPLCNPKSINDRLDAVEDLISRSSLVANTREILKNLPDLERLLRKIHSMGSLRRSTDHPDSRAIFYNEETYSKKKIADFLTTLEGFQNARKLIKLFEEHVNDLKSKLLSATMTKQSSENNGNGGRFPDYKEELEFYENAFDHEKARRDGVIHPQAGVDSDYDMALSDISNTKKQLNDYLEQQKKRLSCKSICYWGTGKNRFQLEIPESALARNTPSEYELQSSKKGFKRYWTPTILKLYEKMNDAEERRDSSLKDTMRKVFYQFDQKYDIWESAVQCIAVLDCLISLAVYSSQSDGIMCRPEVSPIMEGDEPFLEIREGRHPCVAKTFSGGHFIPNDTTIGRYNSDYTNASCLLVTGPNMGGKSTLMRQVGLIVILAQMGCYVPAEKCCLTPIDRVFTRLGAHDRIMSGESTFFVELSETSCILRHATKHSLVLLDELGRGTATYDGTAIASAVIRELSEEIQCRTLFSTHYHSLVEDFSNDANVSLGHMACMVENDDGDDDPSKETITFLYKFVAGACPKSYGFNAARLANIPEEVIRLAIDKARQFEENVEQIKIFRSLTSASKKNIKSLLSLIANRVKIA